MQYSKYLSDKYKADIYLKREDLTIVRSYKIRGAFNLISQLSEPEKQQQIICASAGNHAQGVAYACFHFQIPGVVFMPITTPAQKIEKTKLTGKSFVEIKLTGDTFDEAYEAAHRYCVQENGIFVPPFDHEKIIEGQATIGSEILDQISNPIDMMIVPVGGGGLSAGILKYMDITSPNTEITCAEPMGAPSLYESLKSGSRQTLDKIDTFVDGAAVKQVGKINFDIIRQYIKNEVILVPENRLCETMMEFLFHEGIVLEPAGGLSIDALKDCPKQKIKGKTIVCIVSGGNFDFERLPDVKERALKHSGRKKYFILRLPQRPGALKEFLNLLGPDDDISRFEYLKKSAKTFGSVLLGVETKDPNHFSELFEKMRQVGFEYQDVTDNEILADFVI